MKTFSITSNPDVLRAEPLVGTLLWIGEREASDFRDAYRYCEATSSQVAFRSTLDDAYCRPASDVQKIIVARVDRSPTSSEEIELVASRHASASWLALEGPLCGGTTRRLPPNQSMSGQPLSEHCYLHQWHQHLPGWLARGVHSPNPPRQSIHHSLSLAIIASNYEVASALMDLAETCGCPSAWFRTPHAARMRNFDVVWWDDTVATEATSEQWRQRLQPTRSSMFRNDCVHVWLTNSTGWSTIENAYSGGITCVLTKPFLIAPLVNTLSLGQTKTHVCGVTAENQRRIAA